MTPATVAEHRVRARRFGPVTRVRVDLHGISIFGPGDSRTLIRWEWIDVIDPSPGGVVVASADSSLTLPRGAFGLAPDDLAARLSEARSIVKRPDVIGDLVAGATS